MNVIILQEPTYLKELALASATLEDETIFVVNSLNQTIPRKTDKPLPIILPARFDEKMNRSLAKRKSKDQSWVKPWKKK